jgi:hypothetical protein
MMRFTLLIVSLLAGFCAVTTDAAAAMDPIATCQVFTDSNGNSQDVCATYAAYTPSPSQLANGTVQYVGPYSYMFYFWNNITNGTDTSKIHDAPAGSSNNSSNTTTITHATNLTVSVSWENSTCMVQVSSQNCSSCSLCNDTTATNSSGNMAMTTLSADCSNLPNGRAVDCQPAFIFYPLVVDTGSGSLGSNSTGSSSSKSAAAVSSGGFMLMGLLSAAMAMVVSIV